MMRVENLSIHFGEGGETQEVVRDISFCLQDGEILGIVGESGSGKTMTALTIAGLLKEQAVLDSGSIYLDDTDLLELQHGRCGRFRAGTVSMIFQEPMTALNPTMKIGRQVEEALVLHTKLSKEERRQKAVRALRGMWSWKIRRPCTGSIPTNCPGACGRGL